MKWTLSWLNQNAQPSFTFDERIVYDDKLIKSNKKLLGLKDVRIFGNGYFESEEEQVKLDFKITGIMIVPCAMSLEPVDYPFSIEYEDYFSFDEELHDTQELSVVKGGELDIISLVWELISVSVPLKVVKKGAKLPNSGENWRFVSEDELAISKKSKQQIDPRLEKLKDYFKKK
ncbi:MAG: YceD family protein [Bacilli bacterium]|nr:YceD family protein [Bacilli bacterium]